jgi:tRNA A-37 threonylcarbamoyl transferase component Bud32
MPNHSSSQEPHDPETRRSAEPSDASETSAEVSKPQSQPQDSLREAATLAPSAEGMIATPLIGESLEDAATLKPTSGLHERAQLPATSTWLDADHQGVKFGAYHRVVYVGSWRFGELFHAEHLQLDRRVLLIVLSREWSAQPDVKSWFVETAKSVGNIQDRHLSASILDYGIHDDATYIATPLPIDSSEEYYRKRAIQAAFPKDCDPICDAFIALLKGLKAMHVAGISHGAIQSGNLFLSNSQDGVRFLPFASGIPQAGWFDLQMRAPVQSKNAFDLDYQALALEFIRLLSGHRIMSMPSKPTLGWLRRNLPFISPKLAQLLVRISRDGLKSQYVESTLEKLDVVRREILIPVSWGTRFRHLISEYCNAFLILLIWFTAFFLPMVTFTQSPGGQTQSSLFNSLFVLVFSLPWIVLCVIHLFWEPIFNTTFARHWLQCQLIDIYDRRPVLWRRFVRSFTRMGMFFFFWSIIWLCVTIVRGSNQGTWTLVLLQSYLSPVIAICLVYATAPLFGGVPFHDWISGTRWVQFRRIEDGHSIATTEFQARSQTLLNTTSINASESDEFETIGDIQLLRELGQGGMGTVYLGYDRILNRHVAVKVTMAGELESREAIERFRREAKLGANLDHPNITKVYRVGMWNNQPFMEMEYVDGETFQQVVKRDGAIPAQQAWNWILQAAIGLRESANHGVVHRDIKPSNLMVSNEGLVKVMDFGISKTMDDEKESENSKDPEVSESRAHTEPWLSEVLNLDDQDATLKKSKQPVAPWMKTTFVSHPSLTRTGAMLGTPQYMSPEQAQCQPTDARSDIYSLGLTLYFLLTGRPAFESPSMYDLLMRQCSESPPPLDNRLLGNKQREVLDRMIAKRPLDRFQNYEQLIEALQATLAPEDRIPG